MRDSAHLYELKNGLRGLHLSSPGSISHCAILVKAGTRDEPEGKEGLAHFIEHTLFKGTKKRRAIQILNCLDAVGGELNAYTTKEVTCIHASFTQNYLDRAADLISDIVLHSVFPAAEIKKEKEVVAEEIRMYLDTPSEQVFDDFETGVFRGHALGRNILGTEKSLSGLTRDDLSDFIRSYYHAPNMVFCTCGAFTPAQAEELAQKWFGKLSSRGVKHLRKPFRNYHPAQALQPRDTHQAHNVTGAPAYGLKHPRRTALSLLVNLLGGPAMNSRLSLSIREKHGLAYAVEAGYTPYSDNGLFHVYFGTDPQHLEKCSALVQKELKRLREKPLGAAQLHAAKRQLRGQLALLQEHRLNVLLGCGKSLLMQNRVQPLEKIFADIDALDAKTLRDTANEIMDEKNLSSLTFTAS